MNELYCVRLSRNTHRDRIRRIQTANDVFLLIHSWARELRPPFSVVSRLQTHLEDFEQMAPPPLQGDTRVFVDSHDGKIRHQIDIDEEVINALEQWDPEKIREIYNELAEAAGA